MLNIMTKETKQSISYPLLIIILVNSVVCQDVSAVGQTACLASVETGLFVDNSQLKVLSSDVLTTSYLIPHVV